MPCKTFFHGAVTLVLVSAISGCGDTRQTELMKVTGQVLLDDKPLQFGSVTFQPLQGGQPARGEIDSDGKFVLSTHQAGDGAAVGRHRVKFACYSKQDPASKESTAGDSLGVSLIPERYTSFSLSGVEVSVLAQGNAPFVFKLESDPATEAETSRSEDASQEATTETADAADEDGEPKTGEASVE